MQESIAIKAAEKRAIVRKEFSGPQHAFGAGFFVTFRVFEAGSGRAKLTTWLPECAELEPHARAPLGPAPPTM